MPRFAEHPTPVVLSAAQVPASRDERKSKDPEDLSSTMQLQGVLLKTVLACFAKLLQKNMEVSTPRNVRPNIVLAVLLAL